MATIKAYTDLEQSKKLAEILSLDSADMVYIATADDYIGDTLYTAEIKSEIYISEDDAERIINCWSLAALLDILKDKITFGGNSPEGWFCCYTVKNPTKTLTIYRDSLVDACCEVILKLHDLKLL